MTSACGVVEKVNKEDSGSYEGRVDRNVRAAIKGQKAVTALFVDNKDNVNRAFVEEIEKALNLAGRHTYLYAPADGEDVENVVKHLHRAGLVVLLLVSEKQAAKLDADKYITNWNENGSSVEEVSKFVRMQSAYDGVIVNGRDYI